MTTQQKKKIQTRHFFDEMEEKMQAEASKRKKLRKKPGNSQPELLFLQFDPNGKEDLATFSNKSYSQPNKNNKCKTSWQPPTKRLNTSENFDFSKEKLFHNSDHKILKQGKKDQTKCIKSDYIAKILDETKLKNDNVCPVVKETSPSKPPSNEVVLTSENINCDVKSQDDNKGNVFHPNCSLEERTNKLTTVCDRDDNTHEVYMERDDAASNSIYINVQPRDSSSNNKLELEECPGVSEILSGYNPVYECTEKHISQEDSCNREGLVEYLSQPNHINNSQENKSQHATECDRFNNLEDIPTQCNTKLILNNEIKKDGVISLQKYDISTDHSDHEDIIHSIDLILSEGQNDNDADDKVEGEGEEKVPQDELTNKMLIDSVFENDSHSEDESLEPLRQNASNVSSGEDIPNSSFSEKQRENGINSKTSYNLEAKIATSEVEKIQYKSFVDDETVEKTKEGSSLKRCILIPKEEGVETSMTEKKGAINQFEPIYMENKCDNELEVNEGNKNHNIPKGDEDNFAADDEFSCLMISTSQLLEIEKNYYEGSKHKEPLNKSLFLVKETKVTTDLSSSDGNFKNNISIGTQTESFEVQNQARSIQQNVLPVPTINWPSKTQETQRQLRETIQEVERLNTILLKVRQQIWPSRHSQGSSAGPSNMGIEGTQPWKK